MKRAMSSGNVQPVTGFVLHRRAYQESSFLVDMLSVELGKIRFVARGMRSAKSDRKSVLQPFQLVTCELAGSGELKSLRNADMQGKTVPLKHSALFCGMYVNELLNRCLPANIPCPDLLAQYHQAITQLSITHAEHANVDAIPSNSLARHHEAALRMFELALLDELGYMPDFSADAKTQREIEMDMEYVFVADKGVMLKQFNPHLPAFSGQILHDILNQHWHPDSLKISKWITRQALQPLLGSKPLKSRELFVSK